MKISLLIAVFFATWGVSCSAAQLTGGTVTGGSIGFPLKCGPPLYLCSSTSTANPGTIAAPFTSTAPTPGTCVGNCQNYSFYDTYLNPAGTDCVVRLSDGGSFSPSGHSVDNLTTTGGDNVPMSSVNENYFAVSSGGAAYIFHVNTIPNCPQVINTGLLPYFVFKPFSFSHVVDTRFYHEKSNTQIWQADITSDSTFTDTMLVDFAGAGVCPGINFATLGGTPKLAGPMGLSGTDSRMVMMIDPTVQGTADWAVAFDRVLGCSTVNFNTGQVWAFCTSSCTPATPPLGTFSSGCWGSHGASTNGIHDGATSFDGAYYFASFGASGANWSQGSCAGATGLTTQYAVWQVGTLGNQWGYDSADRGVGGPRFDSHASHGYTSTIVLSNSGYNIRTNANIRPFTTWQNKLANVNDSHEGWPHPNGDDSFPAWIGASDSQLTTQGSGCTFAAMCPIYLSNVVFSINPLAAFPGETPKLFTHTWSCNPAGVSYARCPSGQPDPFGSGNAIGYPSAKGNFFVFASTIFQSLGNDDTGTPRTDAFMVRLQ